MPTSNLAIRFWLALVGASGAAEPVREAPASVPAHYVFMGRDHERTADTAFLAHPRVAGAQLTFTWRELEPARDRYDFTGIRTQLAHLERYGKRLFIQLQDVSFGERILVPEYLLSDTAFHGGAARKYEGGEGQRARFDGWVARRWDPAVRARHARLLAALAAEFDGRIEGIVLPETALSFDDSTARPADFSPERYAAGVREMLSAARRAFTKSHVVIYANFMPGESRPWTDRGYLSGVFDHAARIGAGVGGPDILPHRRGQQRNSLPLIEQRPAGVIGAMAVQDGNLADLDPATGQRVSVRELFTFATERLRLDYIFWGIEEPYFSDEVLPFLRTLPAR